jgi:hypothetical protein
MHNLLGARLSEAKPEATAREVLFGGSTLRSAFGNPAIEAMTAIRRAAEGKRTPENEMGTCFISREETSAALLAVEMKHVPISFSEARAPESAEKIVHPARRSAT